MWPVSELSAYTCKVNPWFGALKYPQYLENTYKSCAPLSISLFISCTFTVFRFKSPSWYQELGSWSWSWTVWSWPRLPGHIWSVMLVWTGVTGEILSHSTHFTVHNFLLFLSSFFCTVYVSSIVTEWDGPDGIEAWFQRPDLMNVEMCSVLGTRRRRRRNNLLRQLLFHYQD